MLRWSTNCRMSFSKYNHCTGISPSTDYWIPTGEFYAWLQTRRNTCVFLIMTWIVISQTYWSTYVKYSPTHDDFLHILPSHTLSMYGRRLSVWVDQPFLDLYDILQTLHSCFEYTHTLLYICAKKQLQIEKMHHFISETKFVQYIKCCLHLNPF